MAKDFGTYLRRAARYVRIGGGLAGAAIALEPAVLGNINIEAKPSSGIEQRLKESPKPPKKIIYQSGFAYAQEPNAESALPSTDYLKLNNEGLQFYINKDYVNAAKKLEAAIRADSTKASPYVNLASVYLDTGRVDEAIELYLKGIKLDPENTRIARMGLAEAYKKKGDKESALREINSFAEMTRRQGKLTPSNEKFVNDFINNL